jgi:hypothetical protein
MNYKNFNAIVYTGNVNNGNKGFIQYRKQTNLNRIKTFCDTKYPQWVFMTIYDRITNEKEIIKRG